MAADRPYQSHLLSFLNRQLQTAKDKTGIIWRTVKLSVSTALAIGVQAIMYPIHAVIKAAELVGKQIQSADSIIGWLRSGQSNPTSNLVHLTSDAPLTSVLTALHQGQISLTTVGTADVLTVALASGLTIQGVASRLSDRRVGLVTSNQQVLDLLSDSQEAQLQHRIRYEIAMYLRWVRSRTLQPSSPQLSSGQLSSGHLAPLQTAPLQTAIASEVSDRTSWIQTVWTRIVRAQAFLSSPRQTTELPPSAQPKLSPITIPTLWTNPSSLGFFSLLSLQDLPNLQELPNLIQAAFRYFFGPSRRYYVRGDHQSRLTDDTWSELETFWGTPPIAVLQGGNSQAPNSNLRTSPLTAMPLMGSTIPTATNLRVKPRTIRRSPAPIVSHTASNPVSHTSSLQENDSASMRNNLVKKTTAGTKHSPDWLEAKSVDLGYKKNWADRTIGWLDWILVKIEQTFLTIWQALVTLFQSR